MKLAILLILIGAPLIGQTVSMGPMTPPLEPILASDLSKWDDTALWAYENGLIEGVWAAAGVFYKQGDTRGAYTALSVLSAYWWQISKPGGMRGAMKFIRAMHSRAASRLASIPLYELVLMEASDLERMTR